MPFTRRDCLRDLALAGAPAILRGARRPGDKPNLLFLWTDEQRADTMAAYGNARFKVPAMNQLAAGSIVFDRAYVSQPVCTPSRSTVMTGLWPHQNGCGSNNVPLPAEMKTFPELLNDPAYRTGYMGKWHLGDEIFAQHGFEEWVGMEDGYRTYFSPGRDRNARGRYHQFLLERGYQPNAQNEFGRGFAARLQPEHTKAMFLAGEASRFLDRHKREPWILYVNWLEPHMPFFGPYDDLHSAEEAPIPRNHPGYPVENEPRAYQRSREALLAKGWEGHDLRQRAGWQRLNRNYAGLCSLVDGALARILAALEKSGQADNTIIVYTSDHGEMMGAHSLIGKGVFYNEAMQVPLLLRVPYRQTGGQRVRRPVSHIDLAPTLLELMGKRAPETLPGRSLLRYLKQDGGPEPVVVEWNSAKVGEAAGNLGRAVISPEGWSMGLYRGDNCLLFDRRQDPLELHNLYYRKESGPVIARLRKQLDQWQRSVKDIFEPAPAGPGGEEKQ